jgi:hypothetical protein
MHTPIRPHPQVAAAHSIAGYRPVGPGIANHLAHNHVFRAVGAPANHVRPPAPVRTINASALFMPQDGFVGATLNRLNQFLSALRNPSCTQQVVNEIDHQTGLIAAQQHGHPMVTSLIKQIREHVHQRNKQVSTAITHAQLLAQEQTQQIIRQHAVQQQLLAVQTVLTDEQRNKAAAKAKAAAAKAEQKEKRKEAQVAAKAKAAEAKAKVRAARRAEQAVERELKKESNKLHAADGHAVVWNRLPITCSHTSTRTHTHTHTHIHTHTHAQKHNTNTHTQAHRCTHTYKHTHTRNNNIQDWPDCNRHARAHEGPARLQDG